MEEGLMSYFLKMDEFLNTFYPKPRWLLPQFFLEGGMSLIAAKPKVGKSHFMQFSLARLSQGKPIFGQETRKCVCVYFCLEEIPSQVQQRFLELGANGEEDFYIQFERFEKIQPEDYFEAAIEKFKPDIIVIDTLSVRVTSS